MKSLMIISTLIAITLSCKPKQDLENSETNNNQNLQTRYTFSQGKEADFGTSTGTYFILYNYSIPVDTFYQKAFPLG